MESFNWANAATPADRVTIQNALDAAGFSNFLIGHQEIDDGITDYWCHKVFLTQNERKCALEDPVENGCVPLLATINTALGTSYADIDAWIVATWAGGDESSSYQADVQAVDAANGVAVPATQADIANLQTQIDNIDGSGDDLSNNSVTDLSDVTDAGSGAIITAAERAKLANITEYTSTNDTPLMNQTRTFETYLTLTITTTETADWILDCDYTWSLNDTRYNFLAHVEHDGDYLFPLHIEPKDSGGTGMTVATTSGGTENTGTDQLNDGGGRKVVRLDAGTHTFTLEFTAQNTNLEATIYDATLILRRVIN